MRGVGGAALALPGLEALASGERGAKPAPKLAIFYVPIGVIRRGFFPGEEQAAIPKFNGSMESILRHEPIAVGRHPIQWTPTLEPLRSVADQVSLVTGLDRTFQIGTDVHAQCASCFLSSAPPFSIKRSAWPLDRTLDHIVADTIGTETPFSTLELSCNSHRDNLESIYFDNISWYGTGHVAPSVRDPVQVYDRLFGTSEIQRVRRITDLVLEDARGLQRELGYEDRQKFGEYFESVRRIELQMDRLERMKGELAAADVAEPPAARLPRGEYIRLMGDLMIAALQTGLTRVATLMVGPERWNTPFLYDGVFDQPVSHHKMSHNQAKFWEDLLRIDRFHMEQFAYLVGRMAEIEEADGSSLLANTLFTYGSGLGDGATHQYTDLPIVIAGSGGGKFRSGHHVHCAAGTPLANLWLTQAQAMGVPREAFAESTGVVSEVLL